MVAPNYILNRNGINEFMKNKIYQGDVIFVDFDVVNSVGNEENGLRPCVVMSNNLSNKHSSLVIVCPLTSKKKKDLPTHYLLTKEKYSFFDYEENIALTENVCSISKERLGMRIGKIHQRDVFNIAKRLLENF